MAVDWDASAIARGLIKGLDDRIGASDRAGAVRLALDAVRNGDLTVPELHQLVLGPLMALVGARWQSGQAEVWQEHYTTAVVRTIVEVLAPTVLEEAARVQPNGRVVVLACPPEEQHDLGLRMLLDRFLLVGYEAHFLGADVPEEEIVLAARALGADILVLSAATHYHRLRLRTLVDSLRASVPELRVLVTGSAFSRGHDGWRDDEVLSPSDDLAEL
ncbi:MAG: cobalamin-dependent protein [Anaerosomatales bacterium]|nr:cobalamin-dependent protein [Anaerosomatales bacterium]